MANLDTLSLVLVGRTLVFHLSSTNLGQHNIKLWLTASVKQLAKALQHRTAKYGMAVHSIARFTPRFGQLEVQKLKYEFCNALLPEIKGSAMLNHCWVKHGLLRNQPASHVNDG